MHQALIFSHYRRCSSEQQILREDAMMPQDWGESFGGRLTRLRHAHQLTQEQLADRSGLSVRAISSLECGARHPRRLTVERLATGLGLTPPERRQLVDAATDRRHLVDTADVPPTPAVPLVGRDRELTELRAHVQAEGPPLLFYVGEPGIGKSRLLAETRQLAATAGVAVLIGSCRRGSDQYAPIVDALARHARRLPPSALAALARDEPGLLALLPELAGLLPDGAAARPAAEHRRLVFNAALRLVEDAARGTGRVVLLLDDLQWAEPAAADLLAYLVTRMGPRLRAVATVRAGELPLRSRLAQCIADLARMGLMGHRSLTPLAEPDALTLVGRPDVVRRAGGLPLFLTELASSVADGIPQHLQVAVRQQLADLPDETRALLLRVATGPAVAPIERLVQDQDTAQTVLTALEPAIRRRILDDTAHGFRFRYPLFREVLAADIGPTRRRLLRQAVAIVATARHLSRVKLT
jgi:transcriptional regulator with XRE-family HTH domain